MKKKLLMAFAVTLIATMSMTLAACTHADEVIDQSLKYSLNSDKRGYTVVGITDKTITTITVLKSISGKPVVAIGDNAFDGCSSITNVIIPDSVTSIGEGAFKGCTGLEAGKGFTFKGTRAQWESISKGYEWHERGRYIITCNDGTRDSSGNYGD